MVEIFICCQLTFCAHPVAWVVQALGSSSQVYIINCLLTSFTLLMQVLFPLTGSQQPSPLSKLMTAVL